MNMLLLGGNGFIGSHLVDKLLAEGHAVRVFDKYGELYRQPIRGVDYRFGDFGNRGLLTDALKDIDQVFHLISTTLPKTSNDDPVFDVLSNVVETIFLLEQSVASNIKKIIFISSGGTVYGRADALPIREDCPTNPECSYGITKLTIEKYLALFYALYGLDYVIVRPANAYGQRQNPNNIQGAISVFLGRLFQDETIEVWGDGEIVRDYLYVSDLVDGIYRASTLSPPSRIYNLGSGTGYSLNDIIRSINAVTGRQLRVEYKARRNFDIPAICLDTSLAKKELGWAAVTPLVEGIGKTWEFIQGGLDRKKSNAR